jgi:hypothetical protein
MLLEPGLQSGASSMQAYPRVVRGDAELRGVTDSHAIDDDTPENLRMLGICLMVAGALLTLMGRPHCARGFARA